MSRNSQVLYYFTTFMIFVNRRNRILRISVPGRDTRTGRTRQGRITASPLDANAGERSHDTDDEEFYRLEKRGFKDLSLRVPVGKDFMLKASEWICYWNYDRSHHSLGGKSPAEALREIDAKLPEDVLFLPPIILDERTTLS